MKKQKKQLIILAVILAALIGGFFGVRMYNQSRPKEESPLADRIQLVSLNSTDIIRFSYDYNGTKYEYDRVDGTWYYAPDHSLKLGQAKLNNFANRFAILKAKEEIDNVEDLSQFGLGEDSRTVSFATEKESETFWIGYYNELIGSYYICRPEENIVYLIDPYVIEQLDVDVSALAEEAKEEE